MVDYMTKTDTKIKFFAPVLIMMTIIGFVIMGAKNLLGNEDYYFLYNRARQLLNCIQDGESIGFFYNDFNGVGYGSTFFYGYLTLIPFLPLLNIGGTIFLNAYLVVASMLFCFGTMYLVSRFTDKYVWITCLYLLSTFVLEMFSTTGLIVNLFAVGLSFFFVGTCIDFFRNSKKFIVSSILFFLILNTHLITALLSFILCVILCVCYFDKNRLKEYMLFVGVTVVFCSHFILDFIWHLDMPMFLNKINQGFISNMTSASTIHDGFFGSNFIFCDVLTLYLIKATNVDGYSLFGIGFLTISLIVLIKYYKTLSRKEVICLLSFVVGLIVGLTSVWMRLLDICNIPIQFPMRYMFYLLLGFYIIVCRRIEKKGVVVALFVLSIPNIIFRLYVSDMTLDMNTLTDLYTHQIVNGEYLSEDFDFNIDNFEERRNQVVDEKGNTYFYVKDKGKLYIKYDTNAKHTLTLPKLYYRGYVCRNIETNTILEVQKGTSQFITITIPSNNNGIYEIYYDDTFFARWQVISYILVVILSGIFLCADFKNSGIKFALNT